jgi:hypothetical protein
MMMVQRLLRLLLPLLQDLIKRVDLLRQKVVLLLGGNFIRQVKECPLRLLRRRAQGEQVDRS